MPSTDSHSSPTLTTRPHSASISSVHFAEPLLHRDSVSSLRQSAVNESLTPPRPVLKARSSSPIRTPGSVRDRSTSPRSVPALPSIALPGGLDYLQLPKSSRLSSQDRRVRSEGGSHVQSERSGGPVLFGKRASVVTGGYETSDGGSGSEDATSSFPSPSEARNSHPIHGLGIRSNIDNGRKRSKSLMVPNTAAETRTDLLHRDALRNNRHNLRSSSFRTHAISPHNVPQRAIPSSRSDSFFGTDTGKGSPRVSTTLRDFDFDGQQRAENPNNLVHGNSGGRKTDRPADSLAATLGFGSDNQALTLTSDQINNLLTDSDVGSALRFLSSPPPTSHLSPNPPTISNSPISSRSATPVHAEPFVAQAPPPLLQDDAPHGRARNVSVSSSIAPAPRSPWASRHNATDIDSLAARRRRASSRADYEGGHIPFTHHIPTVHVEEETITEQEAEPDNAVDPLQQSLEATKAQQLNPVSGPEHRVQKDGHHTRSRLSQLFHLSKKRSAEVLHEPKASNGTDHEQEARSKERLDRDLARRQLEQARRDAELAQERRFRALTQVAAHPVAERMAYRASSHIRAYYNQVFEGIENPPKMNPLAVLRWKHRNEEQLAAKINWQRQEARSSKSPLGWDGQVNSSSASMASGRSPVSFDGLRVDSPNDSHQSVRGPAKWWRYSVEDISAYNAAEGAVNYFIPPRSDHHQPESELEQAAGPSQVPADASSIGGSMEKSSDLIQDRIASISTASLASHPASYENGYIANSTLSLSRAASNDTGKRNGRDHKLAHRSHQSLGTPGSTSLSQALRVPFEKIGSVTKKTRSNTHPRPSSSHIEFHPESPRHNNHITKSDRLDESRNGRKDHHHSRFKSIGGSQSDEGHDREFHLRKLFLKGQQPLTLDARRPEAGRLSSGGMRGRDRDMELQALEKALAREAAFRERQAEAARQTGLEEDARIRLQHLEDEIYVERSDLVRATKVRLDSVNNNLQDVDDNLKSYLRQIEQISLVAKISAEVDIKFHGIDSIRRINLYKDATLHEEATDILSPLPHPSAHESASGSENRPIGSRQSTNVRRRNTNLPSLYSFGPKPWPRRTSLAPDGTSTVNPIRRLELTLHHSRAQHGLMQSRRDDILHELRTMIHLVDTLMKQKDEVRSWTKFALESNRSLRVTVDTLRAEVKGNSSARIGRMKDRFYNTLFKLLLTPLLKVSLSGVRGGRYLWSRRNRESRESFRGIKKASDDMQWIAWLLVALLGMVFWLYLEGGKD